MYNRLLCLLLRILAKIKRKTTVDFLSNAWIIMVLLSVSLLVRGGEPVGSGGYDNYADAQEAMCGIKDTTFKPIPENHKLHQQLYKLYKQLHDGFGLPDKGSVDGKRYEGSAGYQGKG